LTGILLLAAALAGPAPEATPVASRPSFCLEWVRQSREGYERITLFTDRTVVWKTAAGGKEDVRRKTLAPEELAFYCTYFARRELWELSEDLRTGLTGEFAAQASVTLVRDDDTRKRIRYDDLSALSADAAALRSALEGLKSIFTNPLAPASRFTADVLPPGTKLKRFDGAIFKVVRLETEKGIVEIAGVSEPYSQFVPIEQLRFQFSPPE
jgi:hypothetical protein